MSELTDGRCWIGGPKHDWVPGYYSEWQCDRCEEESDD